jgi:CRISPR/Cas system-associated protein Csx1
MKKNTYSFLIILFSSEANVMQQYIYILVINKSDTIQSKGIGVDITHGINPP